jgi:hypothetical protein
MGFDISTPNQQIGIAITAGHRHQYDATGVDEYLLPNIATIITFEKAGQLVYRNGHGKESVYRFTAGESRLIIVKSILKSATIDGVVEETSVDDASTTFNIWWAETENKIGQN